MAANYWDDYWGPDMLAMRLDCKPMWVMIMIENNILPPLLFTSQVWRRVEIIEHITRCQIKYPNDTELRSVLLSATKEQLAEFILDVASLGDG